MAEQFEWVVYNGKRMVAHWPKMIEQAQMEPTYVINGNEFTRVKYGDETQDWSADTIPCHDCGVIRGQYHVPSCDVEECPRCGGQSIGCDCERDEDDESDTATEG